MKKYLLSLLCLLAMTLSLSAASVEKSYKIEFKTAATDPSNLAALSDIVESGAEYLSEISSSTRAFAPSVNGIKFGNSSSPGNITFALSDAGKVKITKMVINSCYFNKDTSTGISVSVNGSEVGSVSTLTSVLANYDIILSTPVEATSITLASKGKRGYVKGVTVYYEEETGGAIDPEFKNIPNNFTMTIGDKVEFPVIDPASLEYSFSVEPADLLIFDNNAKTITANKIGEGTVTFTTKAVEGTYNAASGTFPVIVEGKKPEISFANQVVIGKLGTGVVWQIADVTLPEGVLGDGELVTYESSDPTIVQINEDTGRIKQLDLLQAGEVTITATFNPAGSEFEGEWGTASAEYTIIVKDPNAPVEPGYSIFDFATENPYGLTTYDTNNNKYESARTEIVGDEDVVTISFDKNGGNGYRSWVGGGTYDFRVYSGCKLTFAVPDGYKITKIGIIGKSWTGNWNPESGTVANSDKESGDELEDNFNFVWIPKEGAESASEVKWTCSSNSTIYTIEVLFEAAESDLKSADLSFKKNVYGIIINEPAKINAVRNPEGREIKYTIDGLSEDDYLIEPAAEAGMLDIMVSQTGSFTLRATSAAGDGYRDGLAIMRLNVYRHVTVYKDNDELTEEHIKSAGGCYITMDVHPSLNLYYKLEETPAQSEAKVSVKAADDEEEDENLVEGFEKYEDGIEIPENHEGKLHFYLANYGYKSPVRTMTVGPKDTPTGVEEIVVANGPVKYFDLNGRVVNGKLDKGVYVRVQDGKATKVLVK